MSTDPSKQLPITWNQVAAFRLARHHLMRRAPASAFVAVAGDMGGVQAQLLSAAYISLWSRVSALQMANIEQALGARLLVKAACMRQTQFLVPSEQLAIFVRGTARRAERELRWTRGKGVPDRSIDAAIDAALAVLDQPLTRPEIAGRVCRSLGVQEQAVQGGGWGNRGKVAAVPIGELIFPVVDLLHLVATRGVVCSGPNRGSQPTFVRGDAWIPNWQDVAVEEAEAALLRKYLGAYGPATATDFAVWAGISFNEARQTWASQQSGLTPVNVEGWTAEILTQDVEALAGAGFEQPVIRLLPYFDTFLLGHKERSHLAERQHHPIIYRPQGWIAPVVLVDGRAVATWEYNRLGQQLRLKVSGFAPLSPGTMNGIQAEALDLGRFLGSSSVDVQVG